MTKEALKVFPLDTKSSGYDIFKAIRKGFKKFLVGRKYDFEFWRKATDEFISMKKLHENIPATITCYYDMIIEKNNEIIEHNKELRNKYESDSLAAEAEYHLKRGNKNKLGLTGLTAIGIGVAGIIVIPLIACLLLLLYSIQRNLKRIEENFNKKNN